MTQTKEQALIDALRQELDREKALVKSLEKQIDHEMKVIKVLVAAEHVTQFQVDAANSLIHETKE